MLVSLVFVHYLVLCRFSAVLLVFNAKQSIVSTSNFSFTTPNSLLTSDATNLLIVATLIGFKIIANLYRRHHNHQPKYHYQEIISDSRVIPQCWIALMFFRYHQFLGRHLTKPLLDELILPFVFLFLQQIHQIYFNTSTLPPTDIVERLFLTWSLAHHPDDDG